MSHIAKISLLLVAAVLTTGCPVAPPPAAKKATPPAPPAAPPAVPTSPAESPRSGASSAGAADKPGPADDASVSAAGASDADARPLDLTQYYGMKAEHFDTIKQYPWPSVPRGSQTFAGVPLEIGGSFSLYGEENAKRGLPFPEEIKGIAVGRSFETLYVCHLAYFVEPDETPICEIRFQYDDGTTESDKLLYGSDGLDWFVKSTDKEIGPSGQRSTLAWTGEGLANGRPQKIRVCLTAMANPRPEKTVQAIDLISMKSRCASTILAMTTGKAGLMQPSPAADASDDDARLFQGKWRVVSARQNGGQVPKERLEKMFVEIEMDEIRVYVEGTPSEQAATFTIDPKQDPRQINFIKETRDSEWTGSPPFKLFHRYKWADGKPVPTDGQAEGIYKLEGDTLTLCWRTTEGKELLEGQVSEEQKVRPSVFRSVLYYHQFLYVLERVK